MRLVQPPRLQLHGAKWSSLEGAARGRAEGDAPLAAFSSYSTHDKYRNAAEPVWAETVWSCRLVLSFGLVIWSCRSSFGRGSGRDGRAQPLCRQTPRPRGIPHEFGSALPFAVFPFASNLKITRNGGERNPFRMLQMELLQPLPE